VLSLTCKITMCRHLLHKLLLIKISVTCEAIAAIRCLSTLHGTRLEVLDSAIDMWCG